MAVSLAVGTAPMVTAPLLGQAPTPYTPEPLVRRQLGGERAVPWRLFTNGIARPDAERLTRIEGDRRLGAHLLGAVAIVGSRH